MDIKGYQNTVTAVDNSKLFGNYDDTRMTEKFPNEMILDENCFHLLEQRTDMVALAQTIQNLFFFHKGNFPNQPELGIGIEDYLFEPANSTMLSDLKIDIDNQIKTFIPTTYNINFTLNLVKNTHNMVILSIKFTIQNYDDMTETEFDLLFGRNQNTNKFISKLVV